jgi:GMP synthase-like glutamine amidotransferase
MEQTAIHLIDVTGFTLSDGTRSADWFADALAALGLSERVRLIVHDGIQDILPDPADCCDRGRGVVISGSYGPIWQEKPWIPPLIDFIRKVHARSGWLLGVCFGHHALTLALGGEVEPNPRGREMGTVAVELTPEGERSPLLAGMRSGDRVNLIHRTHVSRMPEGAVLLAFNGTTPVQAFQAGRSFGYQPHPELAPRQLRLLADLYGPVLIRVEHFLKDDEDLQRFKESFEETPASMAVLKNFVDLTLS